EEQLPAPVTAKSIKDQSKDANQMDLFGRSPSLDIFSNHTTFDEKTIEYKLVETDEEIENLVNLLTQQKEFAFSTLFDEKNQEIKALSLSFHVEKGYFIPCFQNPEEKLLKFKEVFDNKNINKITYDLKIEKSRLIQYGIKISQPAFDILLAHYLLEPEMRHRLDLLSENYLKYTPIDETAIIGKQTKTQHTNYEMLDINLLKNCITEKADLYLQLQPILEHKLEENGLVSLFNEIEMPLVEVLFRMEQEGVKIDKEYLQQYSTELQIEKKEIEERIYAEAGEVFNIGSPKQLGDILFSKLKIIDNPPKTATKQFSTAEDVLLKLKDKHPIVQDVLEYRSLSKLISTYLDAFPTLISEKTNRIHTSYNQAVTATGRLSSNNPNLQNIPIRTERGREIRKAFIPRDEEYLILSADYSQIELRIIASLAKDKHMMDAFLNNIDIHISTASRIFGVPIEEVTKDMRRKAKSVNFGIIYGISAFGLSEQLQIPRKEASDLIKEYFTQYPDIKNYIDSNIEFAKENGYVKTMKGRRRYLPEINSRNMNLRSFAERNAVNMPIQGSAADMIKIAMINVYNEFIARGLKSKMILQVHDELVFDIHKTEIETAKEIIQKEMLNALPLTIPIEVEIGVGENWLEAH
ncbi:DNA polymerase I, partial [Bacteroidales bacterium OttesenSCG-928-C19]|nr:DNA polymerase I [Bacteroidales bacterium OttesenSCG-928-C19]